MADISREVFNYQINFICITDFWEGKCGMKVYSKDDKTAILGYDDKQVCSVQILFIYLYC